MNMVLVRYRTDDRPYNNHAVVPAIWLSDLLGWLALSDSTEIISTTHNYRMKEPILPITWPSYRSCKDAIHISDLMEIR